MFEQGSHVHPHNHEVVSGYIVGHVQLAPDLCGGWFAFEDALSAANCKCTDKLSSLTLL